MSVFLICHFKTGFCSHHPFSVNPKIFLLVKGHLVTTNGTHQETTAQPARGFYEYMVHSDLVYGTHLFYMGTLQSLHVLH